MAPHSDRQQHLCDARAVPPPPTARLEFRRWRLEDLTLARALWGDADVMRLLGGAYGEEAARARLEMEIGFEEKLGVQYWPIFLREGGAHVGCCGIRLHDGNLELGFHLHRAFWGSGLALEGARAAMEFGFRERRISVLFAGHHPDNAASRRVLEKLGFERFGEHFYAPTGLMHPFYRKAAP